MVIVNDQTMKEYQSFASLTELDQTVRTYLYKYKYIFNPSTEKVLKCIWRKSGEVYGVAYCSVKEIASEVKISIRQVQRSMNQLQQLNIIKKIPTITEHGATNINLIVIQPLDESFSRKNITRETKTSHPLPDLFKQVSEVFFSIEKTARLWELVLLAYENTEQDKQLKCLIEIILTSLIKCMIKVNKGEKSEEMLERYFYLLVAEGFLVEKRKRAG